MGEEEIGEAIGLPPIKVPSSEPAVKQSRSFNRLSNRRESGTARDAYVMKNGEVVKESAGVEVDKMYNRYARKPRFKVKTKEVDVKDIPAARESRKVSTLYSKPMQGSDFRRRPRKFENFAKLENPPPPLNTSETDEAKKKEKNDEKTGQMVLREVQTESGTYMQHQKLPRLRLEHRYPPKPHKITKEHYVDQPTKMFNVENDGFSNVITNAGSQDDKENTDSGGGKNSAYA